MYIYGYFIPQSLVVHVIAVFEFCGDSVFVSGQGTDTQTMFIKNKSNNFWVFFILCLIFFHQTNKNCQRKTVKLIKMFIFYPFRWGPEVTADKMKLVQHIYFEIPIIHLVSCLDHLQFFEISRVYKICF